MFVCDTLCALYYRTFIAKQNYGAASQTLTRDGLGVCYYDAWPAGPHVSHDTLPIKDKQLSSQATTTGF
jgi:hypothetical protein